jgi:hypothetical protein
MTLDQLSQEAALATGSGIGFNILSLAHRERKFTVAAGPIGGKYVIVRCDTGNSYLVAGTEDRYDMATNMTRVREVKSEIVELTEQGATISERLAALNEELGSFGLVG